MIRWFCAIAAHAHLRPGHKAAWEKKGILHRDVSDTNIVIVDDDGVILDWDLCKKLSAMGKGPTSPRRSVRNFTPSILRLTQMIISNTRLDYRGLGPTCLR